MLWSDALKLIKPGDPNLQILVTGRVGVGKSTLVNALVGMNVTETGDDVVSVTRNLKQIKTVKNGIHVYITDTPGLGDLDIADDDTLGKVQKENVDLFLFCLKMTDRFDKYHIQEIRAITRYFGKEIWKKALFVLTFANDVNGKEHFTSKLQKWENEITTRLIRLVGKVAEKIPIVPTGFREPQLPDRPSWVSEFWVQGFRRMSFQAMLNLISLNKKRMVERVDEVNFAEEDPEDQPLITCSMSRKVDSEDIRGIGKIIGGTLFAVISSVIPGVSVFLAPLAFAAGTHAGNWTAGFVLDNFDLIEKEVHCYDEVILQSLYSTFVEEYPEYKDLLYF